ncbi:MAG: flagellar motor stator protein MotA [Pseudomonadota bacterium]
MYVVIGIVIVFGAVGVGYKLEHGQFSVLFQPVELLIIGGAALGAFVIASSKKIISLTLKAVTKMLSGHDIDKKAYIELLLLLNEIFFKVKREGFLAIEADIDHPDESELFKKYQSVISNSSTVNFICDNFRTIISSNMTPHELESLMEIDMEAQEHDAMIPASALTKVSDGLPALGIVAAVLGVVLTMGKLSEPPAILGQSIGAALVGTFLGILLSYGLVGPLATNLENKAKEHEAYLKVIKAAILAMASGAAPQSAVESARRAIPISDRPGFEELNEEIKNWKGNQ